MDGGESGHGHKIRSHLRGTVQIPENQSPVQHFLHQRGHDNHADGGECVAGVGHGGDGRIVNVLEIGQQVTHGEIHGLGCCPEGHIAQYHSLDEIP